jgi:hypothetical protein
MIMTSETIFVLFFFFLSCFPCTERALNDSIRLSILSAKISFIQIIVFQYIRTLFVRIYADIGFVPRNAILYMSRIFIAQN